uniref:Secreted protein n=1 Tax=Macrostomum lignano TaxID=282301 RepID=A0A1I8J7M6_9PLAT
GCRAKSVATSIVAAGGGGAAACAAAGAVAVAATPVIVGGAVTMGPVSAQCCQKKDCVDCKRIGCEPATDDVECTMLSAIAGDATIDPGVPIEEPNLASSRGADNAADISIDFI